MAAVWFRFHAELRTRWHTWLVLSLLVALGAGVVIAAVAGARRTDSAYSRFLVAQRADDVIVVNGAGIFGFANIDLDEVAKLPDIASSTIGTIEQVAGIVRRPGATPTFEPISLVSDPHGKYAVSIDKLKILEGRAPDPKNPNEVAVPFRVAERLGLHAGSTLHVRFYAPDEPALARVDLSKIRGPLIPLRVVAITAAPGDFPPLQVNSYDVVRATPAFDARYRDRILGSDALVVRLRHGTHDVAEFKRRVERLAGGEPVQFFTQHSNAVEVQRSLHVQAVALYVLAGLAGLVALLVIAQSVTRQTYLEADDDAVLFALGMTRGQHAALVGTRLALIAGSGVAVAVVLAVGLSPLAPIGLAANAEPHPGLAVDGLVLGAGAALAALFVAVVGTAAALRAAGAARRSDGSRGPVALVGWLASAGAPPAAVVGVRVALSRDRGRGAVPLWSSLTGGVLAVATVVGALGFGASLDHLLATPRLYGVGWSVAVGNTFVGDLRSVALPTLRDDPTVRGIAGGTTTEVVLDGRLRLPVLATQPIVGDVIPTVLEGHAPASPEEIMLGTKTMEALGARIGSSVRVGRGDRHLRYRVVGRGVLPDLGAGGLGRGSALTYDGLRRLAPDAVQNYYLVQLRPGTDPKRFGTDVERTLGMPGLVDHRPSAPTDLVNFGRVDNLPFLIAGLIALMAVATLAHTLVTQVQRRRRELAVLKTLGLEHRQLLAVTAWQASTLASLSLLVGIPLGLLLGRGAWRAFADQLGVVDETRTAWLAVLLLIPATLLLANLVAALPARTAARTRPALVLRSE